MALVTGEQHIALAKKFIFESCFMLNEQKWTLRFNLLPYKSGPTSIYKDLGFW